MSPHNVALRGDQVTYGAVVPWGTEERKLLPLLGGYPAKQCPRRVHNDFDSTVPAPPPVPEAAQRRMDEGRDFEAQAAVPLLVTALGTRCVIIEPGDHRADKPRRIAETVEAMSAGASVIIGAQLPDDTTGGRTGSPDLLMRATPGGVEAKYLPADIKHHTTLKPTKRTTAQVSAIGDGFALRDAHGWSPMTSHRSDDGLQLAHYTRMLQALGRHPGDDLLLGAVLGTSDFTQVTGERYGFVWYDLSALTEKTPSKSSATRWTKRSVLDVYDHHFAFRQKVAVAALSGEELVAPFGKAECDECPYEGWCQTAVGAHDVSFAITTGRLSDREWRYLYDQGLGSIEALASADPTNPTLLSGYLQVAAHLPVPERRLATAVRRARMHRDNIPLERTTSGFEVPVADVEIDFDVEWHPADGHVYQWGARVRHGQDEATATYEHSVLSFDTLDDASAYELAQNFFDWMEAFVAEHEAAGRSVGIYHWTTPETRLATKMLGGERADRLFEGRFVDLKALMATHFFARDGFSLKTVAPLFNFQWRSPDAGGETSVLRVEQARNADDPATAQAAREWLLTYNEDDCTAQAAIRDGLRRLTEASSIAEEQPVAAPAETEVNAGTGTVLPTANPSTSARKAPRQPARRSDTEWGNALTTDRKGLSLNEIRTRVARFVVDYKDVTNEKQNTGDFWRAFMRCYGVEDSYLQGVTFEYPARRSNTGGSGFIDVFLPGKYLIEQKTTGKIKRPKGAERSNAEMQADDYLTGGDITEAQMPRWVVTSDFAIIQVTDLSAPRKSPVRTKTIRTADLVDHVELFLFLTGQDSDALIAEEQAEASIAAARLMGDLYAAMTGDDDTDGTTVETPEEEDAATMAASILLTRLLFLMFGDDAGLWPTGMFQKFIAQRTSPDGSDLGPLLGELFKVLDKPEPRDRRMDEALREFPHVNGALFKRDDTDTMWFDKPMRDALLSACKFDWSRISPAVFGSLFQTVKSKEARRSDGEHYTSEANILKTLRPMFLDDFRTRLDAANTKPALEKLHAELRNYRYVDPACGCGNFLIVAYREMRAIELDLLVKLQTKRGKDDELVLDPSDMLHVRLDQFYGIELNWWPAKIAETAMFLVDHQANQAMAKTLGYTPNRLPIDIAANITHGNALTTDWDTVLPAKGPKVFMFGNPPFLGDHTRDEQQLAEMQAAWGPGKQLSRMDFVTSWHAKALAYLDGKIGDFGFVTTNSIVQGDQVHRLFDPIYEAGWHIKFAHRTFAWDSETAAKDKAAVHCVIVGFTRDNDSKPRLFDYPSIKADPVEVPVKRVNCYLFDGPDITVGKRSTPLSADLPAVNYGSKPTDGGHLVVTADEYDEVSLDPLAAKYLRPYIGSTELIHSTPRWCLWMVGADPSDINKSPILKKRVAAVRDERAKSTAASTRDYPHHHLFRQMGQPTVPYLAIPEVFSEARPYATAKRLDAEAIASNKIYACPDPDGFAFAIISSSMFITWQKTVGGRLKSDPSFSSTIVWNNLPLPSVPVALRKQIVEAGKAITAARAIHPDRSLAMQYQALGMDPELVKAHQALDRLVDKAFGAPRGTKTEAQRQAVLFARYEELTNALGT